MHTYPCTPHTLQTQEAPHSLAHLQQVVLCVLPCLHSSHIRLYDAVDGRGCLMVWAVACRGQLQVGGSRQLTLQALTPDGHNPGVIPACSSSSSSSSTAAARDSAAAEGCCATYSRRCPPQGTCPTSRAGHLDAVANHAMLLPRQ
jgi:hypothetical protein